MQIQEEGRVEEALELIAAARARSLHVKLLGGIGCWLQVASAGREARQFRRNYEDIDLIARRGEAKGVVALITERNYEPLEGFNAVQGETRRLFVRRGDPPGRIDLFIHTFDMCHKVPIEAPAFDPEDNPALALPELLLTKLQVVESTDKDLSDAGSLLAFHEFGRERDQFDATRFATFLAGDWGLWKTVTTNLERLIEWSPNAPAERDAIKTRAAHLLGTARETPKSLRWKARAAVGTRVPWYEEPEEPETRWVPVR